MSRALVAGVILAITALSFFIFPGHTYLQQDTQIYVPILENQWSGALADDLIVQSPHVSFTFYDELTYGIRWITRAPLRMVLEGQQLFFRALGFLGIFLIALALGLDWAAALVVTAVWALGATIAGPAVLTIEFEPSPRSFAVPLLMLAAGLALDERYWWAGLAGAAAFVLHAPTTWPFWLAYLALTVIRPRAAVAFIPLCAAVVALVWAGLMQRGGEAQQFFAVLSPATEALQRMRAPYNYVSLWWKDWIGQYLLFAAIAFAGLWRLRARREIWVLLGGLVAVGLLSVPLSGWLLDRDRLALVPQVQPARALLFVTAAAVLAAAAAGVRPATRSASAWIPRAESFAWLAFALWVPVQAAFFAWPGWRAALVVLAFALLLAMAGSKPRLGLALLIAPAIAVLGGVVNYVNVDTPDLAALAHWARLAKPGAYAFPESGHDHALGWFRAESLQPVYVDWKGGGQVNYLPRLGEEWWRRWQAVMLHSRPLHNYRDLGIDYVVVPHPLDGAGAPVFHRGRWFVYKT